MKHFGQIPKASVLSLSMQWQHYLEQQQPFNSLFSGQSTSPGELAAERSETLTQFRDSPLVQVSWHQNAQKH